MTSQVRLKWNTQWRLGETSPRNLRGTSPQRPKGGLWQSLKSAKQQHTIGSPPLSLKLVSNETPEDVSTVRFHDVSQERCSDVSNVPHYVSGKSQIKHPAKSRWYVSNTSLGYVAMTSY